MKLNLFTKTFAMSIAMLMSITLIICILIYALLPRFYEDFQLNNFHRLFNTYSEQLENAQSLVEEARIIHHMLNETSISFNLLDENHHIILSQGNQFEAIFISRHPHVEIFPMTPYLVAIPDPSLFLMEFHYQQRTLQLFVPIYSLTEARQAIFNIFPIAGIIAILFAFLMAFIFSKWFVVPIQKIQTATKKMAKIEPNVQIEINSNDEIGALSEDLNQLYAKLQRTILTLNQEIKRFSDSENKKIDFLQSVSHEMKTPLTSANALIEGILCEVPPYHDNPKKYLEECHLLLQKSIMLTKESLNLSEEYKASESKTNLRTLITDILSLYEVILQSKQIIYIVDVPNDINIHTKLNIFSKVFSNLISNATNYTPIGGKILITCDDNTLSITNTCTPIENVDNLFKPLHSANPHEHATGLGLYIVKQLLTQLKLGFSFKPTQQNNGMTFSIYFDSKK